MKVSIWLLAGIAAAQICAGVARGAAIEASNSSVQNSLGNIVSGSGTSHSLVYVDSNNFAESYVNSATGAMGVQVANSNLGMSSSSDSEYSDAYWCSGVCEVPSVLPALITFHFDGWASASSNYMSLSADYLMTADGFFGDLGELTIGFTEDPGTDPNKFVEFDATFRDINGHYSSVPHTLTVDANGNYVFSVDYTANVNLCGFGDCSWIDTVGPAANLPLYSDSQRITATIAGDGTPQILDAYHTFRVGVTSQDPNFQLSRVESVAAPEPQALGLIGIGLLLVVGGGRRRPM